jgi:hypothetical protein
MTVLPIGGILAAASYLSLTHLRHQIQIGHCSEYCPYSKNRRAMEELRTACVSCLSISAS